MTASQLEQLLKSSEGWFAAVYLNLCSFSKSGELPGKTSDIYQMFSASMLNPLPEDRKEFLSAMGLQMNSRKRWQNLLQKEKTYTRF